MHKFGPFITLTGVVLALAPITTLAAHVSSARGASVGANSVSKCTLSPSLNHSDGNFGSCISVGATLPRIPMVGQTATLTVTVKTARIEPHTVVTINLPPTFAFADGTATHAAFVDDGSVAQAHVATFSMTPGRDQSVSRVVRAIGSGFGQISVTAQDRRSRLETNGGADSVFVTTGKTRAQTYSGARGALVGAKPGSTARAHYTGAGPAVPAIGHVTPLPALKHPASQVTGIRRATPGTACATGKWLYVDQDSVTRPAQNVLVEIVAPVNDVLAQQYTGPDGSFDICWSTGGSAQDIQIYFAETNDAWIMVDSAGDHGYTFIFNVPQIADGTTYAAGNLEPDAGPDMLLLQAYQEASDEYEWIYRYTPYTGGCWSPYETTCRQMVIHWQADSTSGTYWNTNGVFLSADAPSTLDEPADAYAKALMYYLYGENYPPTTNCASHFLFTASSETCAWTEGWAEWVATSVYDNMVWTVDGGGTTNLNVTWNEGLGYDTGDQVEGRIVQAIRSLTDGVKAPFDNDPGEGHGVQDNTRWFTGLSDYKPDNFVQMWEGREALGYDTGQTALSALYQGTIDFGFRNPLQDYVGKHMPEARPNHAYSYTTTTPYWSVVAEKPDVGNDADLNLYGDYALTDNLGNSSLPGNSTDFVGINSNFSFRPLQTYFPVVDQFVGSGGYTIMEAQGQNTLTTGEAIFGFGPNQPVAVWNSDQAASVPVTFRAVPDPGVDAQLCYMNAGAGIVSRAAASCGTDPGAGVARKLIITPSVTGWGGLVLLNNSLTAGDVTVYADTTPPAGTVSINGGAATTTSTSVNLALSATDAETGLMDMQISTDGTFSGKAVVPYATSATATLPPGNGTKHVLVRFENNAGMWSATSDATITLNAIDLNSISQPSGRLAGGNTLTIHGEGFTGATEVKFGSTVTDNFTVVSPTKVNVVAPAHAAGTVNVRVIRPGGSTPVVSASRYVYLAAPTVASVSPAAGPPVGGGTITIHGTGFTNVSAVKFNLTAATDFTVNSSTTITATVPAGSAGTLHVRVSTPGGLSASATANAYTYEPAPTITGIAPSSGPAAGGTTVTVTGTNFVAASEVKFGTHAAATYTVVSPTKITVSAPAGPAGTVHTYVKTPSGMSTGTASDHFTYS